MAQVRYMDRVMYVASAKSDGFLSGRQQSCRPLGVHKDTIQQREHCKCTRGAFYCQYHFQHLLIRWSIEAN